MMIAPNKGISFAIIEPEAKRGIVHYCSGTRAETSTTLPQIPVLSPLVTGLVRLWLFLRMCAAG
ncbi:hypothetical protein ABES58_22650 [Paenibacillus lautus]|uniref:hypothetical protein n=1 Tax=Paenibacillus lautus TaxID=1401 RepID=UPI003D283497